MSFKILYVAATSSEADALRKIKDIVPFSEGYRLGNCEIHILIGGVGSVATAWAMKQWISLNEKPHLAVNAGIAGSFKDAYSIGEVVMPQSDCFADSGIEDGDKFLTLSEAGLCRADEFPFKNGLLYANNKYCDRVKDFLKPVRAITLNTATGSEETRNKLMKKFNPDIETMEGASFFYICTKENIPFLALRAISNKVGPRDKSKWDIALALDNLSETLYKIILMLD